jgi:predicted dehydrogenase
MKCAIIGSTKIAEIHIREYINNGAQNITIISRKLSKTNLFIKKLNEKFNFKFEAKNISVLKKQTFDIIDICSNTKYHLKHLNYIPKNNSLIVIEKPIFDLNNLEDSLETELNQIYKKHKKVFICYPMYYLGKSFLNKYRYNKKIKKIEVVYKTKGKHKAKDICLDLAPHALSLIYSLVKPSSKSVFNSIKLKYSKLDWISKGYIDEIEYSFKFSENKSRDKSKFFFKINNQVINRPTKIIKNVFNNYLMYKKEIVLIANPMSQVIKQAVKSKSNKSILALNKNLTYWLMQNIKRLYD